MDEEQKDKYNKIKRCFFEKSTKLNVTLVRLTKGKQRRLKLLTSEMKEGT